MRSLVFSFFVLVVLSATFLAVGLLIAFWPATYLQWVRWSKVEYLVDSRVGRQPRTLRLAIQNSRHWDGTLRCYCGHPDCVDSLVPITGCSMPRTTGSLSASAHRPYLQAVIRRRGAYSLPSCSHPKSRLTRLSHVTKLAVSQSGS